jgi:hypothetical protein
MLRPKRPQQCYSIRIRRGSKRRDRLSTCIASIDLVPESNLTLAMLPAQVNLVILTPRAKVQQAVAEVLDFSARGQDAMHQIIKALKMLYHLA